MSFCTPRAAYPGSQEIEVPPELPAALAADPAGLATFEALSSQDGHAIL